MHGDYMYPLTAWPSYLVGIGVVAYVGFYLVLTKYLRFGKIAWKRVDYIWLTAGIVGLWGSAIEVRRLSAAEHLEWRQELRQEYYSQLREQLQFMTGPVLCARFQRTQYSPPDLDRIQRLHDQACEFAKRAIRSMPLVAPDKFDRRMILEGRPPTGDPPLDSIFGSLDRIAARYFQAESQFTKTSTQMERSSAETNLVVAAPLLLCIALALRFAKVTGEVELELRESRRGSN